MLLSKSGLDVKLRELEDIKKKLKEVRKDKSLAISQADGDGWHDNFTFEQAERDERRILASIRDLEKTIKNATIISDDFVSDTVQLNCFVTLLIDYGSNEIEKIKCKIVDVKNHIDGEITLNSPIGKSIFGKKVNEHVKCVLPSGKEVGVTIVEIEF